MLVLSINKRRKEPLLIGQVNNEKCVILIFSNKKFHFFQIQREFLQIFIFKLDSVNCGTSFSKPIGSIFP